MILKRLKLVNFGIYADENMIDLTTNSPERPVVLIGGMNGRGKTTIFEAILLSLYGDRSYAFTSGKMSYSEYLKNYICTSNQATQACLELSIKLEDDQPELVLRREWSGNTNTIKDKFTITKDGINDPYLADCWATMMETILPSGVAKLFFFDGEKITELANDETDEELKKAICSLLGIDTVNRLISDIKRVIDKQNPHEKSLEVSSIIEKKNEISKARIVENDLKEKIEEQTNEIQDLDQEIKILDQKIIKADGKLSMKRKDIEEQISVTHETIADLQEQLKDMLAGPIPLMLIHPLLNDLCKNVETEHEKLKRKLATETILEFKEQLLVFLEGKSPDKNLVRRTEQFIDSYTESAEKYEKIVYNASTEALVQLKELCFEKLEKQYKRICNHVQKRHKLEKKLQELNEYLRSCTDESTVTQLLAEYSNLTADKTALLCNQQDLLKQKSIVSTSIENKSRELRLLQQQVLEQQQEFKVQARVVKYANFSIDIMEKYRESLLVVKLNKFEHLINEKFRKIIGKENLIDKISIDPKTLNFLIKDKKGESFSKSKLSAGERQMLAISILWGLTTSVQNALPVIIDTPLARLDSRHRKNFIEKYLPNAGNQVIVLSTDEEITQNYVTLLNKHIASSYLLKYNTELNNTQIMKGYFGGH